MKSYHLALASLALILSVPACGPGNISGNSDDATGASGLFLSFEKPAENPIVGADSTLTFFCPMKEADVQWQKADVFNPAAIVKDGKVHLLLRCEDNPDAILGGRTSRIGLATSSDGIHFERYPEPVLYPANDGFEVWDFPGGCEDPRVAVTEDGLYVMAYTAWNQDVARLSIAFSRDLVHWEKKGPAFASAYDGKFLDRWSKSGSMLTRMDGDRQTLVKKDGRYWMYWGEDFINLAWSENLADWYPQVDEAGELLPIVETRPGHFDSRLTECGPPALWLEEGIVLLYNGKNAEDESADPALPRGTYSVGKVVFDPDDLTTVRSRLDQPLLKPSLPHEMTGQYASGTTFAEGLVHFQGKWFLYYGTADSYVGVAVQEDPPGAGPE
ncbi:MAG: glycoside hydrolase family 130 protein [Bacteroidales bacterium]